jgi:hypothetical protein
LQSVRQLGEFKGREGLYRSQMPQALETLRQTAIIQSAESSNRTELVLEAIGRFHGDFSVSELQAQCPNVGIDLIRRLLRQERKAGKLECLGRGPAARWRRK